MEAAEAPAGDLRDPAPGVRPPGGGVLLHRRPGPQYRGGLVRGHGRRGLRRGPRPSPGIAQRRRGAGLRLGPPGRPGGIRE